jgi:cysteine desulfurase
MWWGSPRVYLDNASSTLPLQEAIVAMRESEHLRGNPGGIHGEGVEAKEALAHARSVIAKELACKARDVIFTSGLTESINLAILGFARNLQIKGVFEGTHWIVSSIEHSAVLECFGEIEPLGGTVTHINPDERGIFLPEKVLHAIRENTIFISIGWSNSEIGIVQPIRDISRAVKEKHPHIVIHSDAGQAPPYLSPHVHTLGVDLMSLGSNKLYGPHGVGALYVSRAVDLSPVIFGGKQERGLRSGTENVALAAGFARAFETIARERADEALRLRTLRDAFARDILAKIPGAVLNTDIKHSLPHMLNVSFPDIQSEYVTLALDRAGIAISTKSACREGEERRSHVVDALRGPEWRAANTLRFSLGRDTTRRDLARALKALISATERKKM